MKIAIHNEPGGFHSRWIRYCEERGIQYKLVNCRGNDIVEQLSDCGALMWHHHQGNPEDLLCAKQILFAVQQSGKVVFPDFNTGWHFDDKVGQKYLLESIKAPVPAAYVFYNKKEALEWSASTTYPKVFKLRSGAGSLDVQLVKSARRARSLIRRAFGKGFSKFNRVAYMKERVGKSLSGLDRPSGILKGIGRFFIPTDFEKRSSREKGYVYFQEFLPGNDHDIRVIVIGERAFAIKRLVRKNDFRASGSGRIIHDKDEIDIRCVKIGFDLSKRMGSQCVAFDFVYKNNEPIVIEVSYGFSPSGYDKCPGYWDRKLDWHEGPFDPYGWMIEDILINTAE